VKGERPEQAFAFDKLKPGARRMSERSRGGGRSLTTKWPDMTALGNVSPDETSGRFGTAQGVNTPNDVLADTEESFIERHLHEKTHL
jgi:hypothetical protein